MLTKCLSITKKSFFRRNIASFLTLIYSRQSQTLILPIHFTAFHIFDLKIKLLKTKQYDSAADFTELRPWFHHIIGLFSICMPNLPGFSHVKHSNHSSVSNQSQNLAENHFFMVNLCKITSRPFQNNTDSRQEKFRRISWFITKKFTTLSELTTQMI